MKSVMQHSFSQVPKANIPRSVFDRTHGYKTTFDAGYLIPVLVDQYVPGDTFNVDATFFARLATPIYPLMDNMYLDVHFFSIPYRLLWTNFKKFMGERATPTASIAFTIPQMDPGAGGFAIGTLGDYFGLPIAVANKHVNALPFRAYNLCWNEWYKSEHIQDNVVVDVDDGEDAIADYVLLRRGKRHDYFTSAIPWPQSGSASSLPLGDVAYVKGIAKSSNTFTHQNLTGYESDDTNLQTYAWAEHVDNSDANTNFYVEKHATKATPNIYADLANATASTINELREAFQIQKLLERDARGGTRYAEIIISHFGVEDPQHAVLQRPEYLGGSTAPLVISPVANTSATATEKQGNLSGIGTIACRAGFTKSFTEHGLILGLVSVRADLTYQQGLDRLWSISTRYDMYWPAFANLGEQTILTQELVCDGSANDDDVFGYQERYAEYRYFPSKITGKLRSVDAGSLDAWHLSQDLAAGPTLSPTFIVENPPMTRVIAVNTEPHFIMDSYIKMHCARPMPVYSVPGNLDRL